MFWIAWKTEEKEQADQNDPCSKAYYNSNVVGEVCL